MNDQEMLARLAEAYEDIEPVPAGALDVAYAAIGMRDLDGGLAEVIFDSWRDEQAVAMRATATDMRLMTFAHDDVTIDLELHDDGTVVGQITRADTGGGAVEPDFTEPPGINIESHTGDVTAVEADGFGRFRFAAGPGPLRLQVAGLLTTPWISR